MTGFYVNCALIAYTILLSTEIVLITGYMNRKTQLPAWLPGMHIAGSIIPAAVFLIFLSLFVTDQFQFYQVWSHSSDKLPLYYKIAALWEGQEGSFLLWAVLQSITGTWVITRKSRITNYSAAIVMLVNIFVILPLIDIPSIHGNTALFNNTTTVLNLDPDTLTSRWLLQHGNGMNPLLRNFWMTIHPPVIFISFALAGIPFAVTLTGIFIGDTSWVVTARYWLKFSLTALTAGILMGAYWAYETLSFGGYWSWDPVENAIFIPWLAGISALHINQAGTRLEKGSSEKRLSLVALCNCLYFLLIIYSTFLTRSGLLQDTSVHAFVNTGYNSILIIFLSGITLLTLWVFIAKRKLLPSDDILRFRDKQELLVIMALVLALAGLHLFINTSLPVFNHIFRTIGLKANFAPPASPVSYSIVHGIFAALLLLVLLFTETSGKSGKFYRFFPAVLTVCLMSAGIISWKFITHSQIVAMVLVILSVTLFGFLTRKLFKSFPLNLTGSLLSHIGFILLLTGTIFSCDALRTGQNPKRHSFLVNAETEKINGRNYTFEGRSVKDENDDLIDKSMVTATLRHDRFIAKDTIRTCNAVYPPGSVIKTKSNDLYFKVADKTKGESFYASIYFEQPTSYFAKPYISRGFFGDVYLSISNFRDNSKIIWRDSLTCHINASKGYRNLHVRGTHRLAAFPGIHLKAHTAYMISLLWKKGDKSYLLTPVVITRDDKQYLSYPDFSEAGGISMHIINWTDENNFQINILFTDKDWITVLVEDKPLINFFWLGGMLMMTGIIVSLKKQKSKYDKKGAPGTATMAKNKTSQTKDLITENEKYAEA